MFTKHAQVITPRTNLWEIRFNQEETELVIKTTEGENLYYTLTKTVDDKDRPIRGYIAEYDLAHQFKDMMATEQVVFKDVDECECGISVYHVHCKICGKLLRKG